jgi:type IV secretory pathway VirB4 component
LLIESCPATFALPNPAARTPKMAAIYEQMGFNSAEISMIASLRPQRDLYYANDLVGKRSCSLLLSPLILALCARNTQEDHALMDEVLAKHGREGFAAAWLETQRFPEQAAWLRTQGSVEELLTAEVVV